MKYSVNHDDGTASSTHSTCSSQHSEYSLSSLSDEEEVINVDHRPKTWSQSPLTQTEVEGASDAGLGEDDNKMETGDLPQSS